MLKTGLSGIRLLRMTFMWLFALSIAHAQSGAGTTVTLADVMGPLTPGQVVVTDSGVTRVWGSPQTQADGTQLFPRLVVGLPNTTASISYFSSDTGGLKLHKTESATGSTSTWAPAQLIYPATMTIGQTYETIHAQTSVANIGAAPVLSTIKIRTTILGFEPIALPQGSMHALKIAQQYLTMLPDGTYPDVATVGVSQVWLASTVAGSIRSVYINPVGMSANTLAPVTVFAQGMMDVAGLPTGPAPTSTSFTLSDLMIQFTPGKHKLFSNGQSWVFGPPQTLADGTQIFPRLTYGSQSTVSTIAYQSQDSAGLKLHKVESSSGASTSWSPPQLVYPGTMTVGQSYESIHTQTALTSPTAAPTVSTIKVITTIVGVEPVVIPLGTYPALKLAQQYLTALPDGSFPDAASVGTTYSWLPIYGGGTVKTEYRNATGASTTPPTTLFGMDTINVTGLSSGTALSGGTIALADVMGPIVAGKVVLMSNGQVRIGGTPQTQTDGTQLYPRLSYGGPSTTASASYYSLNAAGFWLHKAEISNGMAFTFSPPELVYPTSMTVGQTYESLSTQTVTSVGTAPVVTNIKFRTTVVGIEPVVTPMGTFQSLKLAQQTLTAMPDGSYQDPATVTISNVWLSQAGGGYMKFDNQYPAGSASSSVATTLFGITSMNPLGTVGGALSTGLVPGWNLLGNSLNQAVAVAPTLGDPALVTTVWKWDVAVPGWQFYTPLMDAATLQTYAASKGYGVLSAINPGEGYWVNAKATATLPTQTGTAFALSPANLVTGWNLVATGSDVTPSAFNTSLSATPPSPGVIPLNLTTLWAWDNPLSQWYFYAPSLEASGGLAAYITGKGYLNFAPYARTLGKGTGFWVNKP